MSHRRNGKTIQAPFLLADTSFRGKSSKGVKLIYEDDYLLVVDKPSGLLTMSTGREGEVTAYSILTEYVRATGRGPYSAGRRCRETDKGRYGRRERNRVFIVHRIDRDTSGLLIFAKDPQTKYELQEDWNDSIIERKYIAVIEGVPQTNEDTIISWLRDNPATKYVSSSMTDNGGKKAVTHYRILESSGTYSLAEFELETGRKNQIRVHAAVIGHPIAGDRKYGAKTNPCARLALHASTISFRHPVTGKLMTFNSGIPGIFRNILKQSSNH